MIAIIKEAKKRKLDGYGFNASRSRVIWQSDSCSWNWFGFRYGIRRSHVPQILPVWNTSHNCQRSLMFGIGWIFLEVVYYRSGSFNQSKKRPFQNPQNKWLWSFYQLID